MLGCFFLSQVRQQLFLLHTRQHHDKQCVRQLVHACKAEKYNLQFPLSDAPVTLKYGHGYQNCNKRVDFETAYNHAKFEMPYLIRCGGNANVKGFH